MTPTLTKVSGEVEQRSWHRLRGCEACVKLVLGDPRAAAQAGVAFAADVEPLRAACRQQYGTSGDGIVTNLLGLMQPMECGDLALCGSVPFQYCVGFNECQQDGNLRSANIEHVNADPDCNLDLRIWHLLRPAGRLTGPPPSEQAGSSTTLSSIGSITCTSSRFCIKIQDGLKGCTSTLHLIHQSVETVLNEEQDLSAMRSQ